MTSDSDDEFGDGHSFEYDEALETQLQIIESQAPVAGVVIPSSSTDLAPSPADKAPSTRRKLEHLDISLEDELDDEVVDDLVGEDDQIVLDVLNAPASQSSKYEEDLVQQVTSLIPGATQNVEPTADGVATELLPIDGSPDRIVEAAEGDETEGKRKKSLFEKFRKRGFFSVTDLVAPSWCEVQFDYRLRSKSYLPVAARPDTITTSTGAVISVNKVIAGTGEKIMRKGEQVHKKLEREIHPVEVQVKTESREDVWGLRFLNMFASLEALLTLGKCRELPVVGFIKGYMIVGVIDEITRQPLISYSKKKVALASTLANGTGFKEAELTPKKSGKAIKPSASPNSNISAGQAKQSPQKTLFAFYRPLRSKSTAPRKVSHERTHMLYVSDSKTRAGGTMPKEENSVNGKMQLMLYKEMLDGMIVEGLRQHALEQKAQQQSEVEEDEDFQILDVKADDDVICLGSEEPQEGLRQSRANGCETDSDNRAAPQTQKTSHRISSTVDRFTWRELFEHLSLDPAQPFTDGFLEQSRLLIEGNNLSVGVAGAETLQQMTSCWAEYVSKLGLGTIDPTQSEEQIEEALEKEIGGRRTGRSEKLLTLVYRRVGTTKKKKRGDRRSQTETGGETGYGAKRGKRRKRGGNAHIENNLISAEFAVESDPPSWEQFTQVPADEMEVENERLLQLAIAESLDSTSVANGQHNPVQETIPSGATEMDLEEEPLPATLLPPEIFQATQQKLEQTQPDSQAVKVVNNVEPKAAEPPTNTALEKATEDSEGSIIGSQRFPYSSDLLSEHIDRILQFWTGIREPVGVSIENTTRCGWCEFEDGCEWRAAKSVEAANRNVGLQSSRRLNARPACL